LRKIEYAFILLFIIPIIYLSSTSHLCLTCEVIQIQQLLLQAWPAELDDTSFHKLSNTYIIETLRLGEIITIINLIIEHSWEHVEQHLVHIIHSFSTKRESKNKYNVWNYFWIEKERKRLIRTFELVFTFIMESTTEVDCSQHLRSIRILIQDTSM